MKVSAAAVLVSVSTASAFNVGYLNQLGGSAAPAKEAPAFKEVVSSGPASYLDNLNTPELVQAIETAPAPAPVAAAPAPAPVAAAPAAGDYLGALNSGSTATAGAGITSYLDSVSSSASAITGGGLTGYLDALPASTAISGGGVASYLDSVGGSAPAPVAAAPATAAPVAAAPAAPAPVAAVAAPAAGDYLSTLAGSSALSGGGISGYLDALPASSTQTTGSGLAGYLDVLAVNAGATGAGMAGYLDVLATNSVSPAAATASPSVTSFLENVYSQIMALPADQKTVSGDSVTFASTSGPYAMSFIKN